jgi:pyrroline-5-carboxylate reductase
MKLLLVGCGKMGGAMLARWADLNLCEQIVVVEPNVAASLPAPITVLKSAQEIPDNFTADIVVFAVKPQSLQALIKDYARFGGALFISIAAGVKISFFEEHLGKNCAIVRAMPNTPAAIGQGATAAIANKNVGAENKSAAEKLLSATGLLCWVDNENLMNAVTALSGSGPAYVFLLIEEMARAGAALGLPADAAAQLARQTVIGSAALAAQEKTTDAATLRQNVTSPGGTTEAALNVLMGDSGLRELMHRALAAAEKRGRELAGDMN